MDLALLTEGLHGLGPKLLLNATSCPKFFVLMVVLMSFLTYAYRLDEA